MKASALALAPWLGAGVGVVLALTGAGGAILAVPLLVFGLHMGMAQAGPVGLLAVTLAALTGAALGWRAGVLRYRAAALMAGAGVLASPLGLWLSRQLPERPLMLLFAGVLAVSALRMLHQSAAELGGRPATRTQVPPCRLDAVTGRLHWSGACAAGLLGMGAAAGLLSGLLGVGGGFVLVPALLVLSDLPMKAVVATSMGVIALVSGAGVLVAGATGLMNWIVGLPFAAGALGGLLAGRAVAKRLAGPRLQQGFAVLSLSVALALAIRALG
jgi:uncharacterized membrane protein YfcA